jgi:hypothetical protein
VSDLRQTKNDDMSVRLRESAVPIVKEPTYTATPSYALLVFGEDVKHQSWLVMDGERTLYLDRNGDGDLTGPDEQIPLTKDAAEKPFSEGQPLSEREYLGMNEFKFSLQGHDFQFLYWVPNEQFVPPADDSDYMSDWRRQRKQNGWFSASLMRTLDRGGAQIPVTLCGSPANAQISHIDGPLTFQTKWGSRQVLKRSEENTFDVHVGTTGVPTTAQDMIPFASLSTNEVPEHIHPVAQFEFSDKHGQPIRRTVELVQRC